MKFRVIINDEIYTGMDHPAGEHSFFIALDGSLWQYCWETGYEIISEVEKKYRIELIAE